MQESRLIELIEKIIANKHEGQTTEVKASKGGPPRVYKTLSSFSNTNDGVIVFGLDENDNFKPVGVYNAQKLQEDIFNQCQEMVPAVRYVATVVKYKGVDIVSAEIPEIVHNEKPCYHKASGTKSAHIRVGNNDSPMSEFEIYSYEIYKRHQRDDIRPIEIAVGKPINQVKIDKFLLALKTNRSNLATTPNDELLELNSFTKNGVPSLAHCVLFSIYPQAFFPNLCIHAVVVPGYNMGDTTESGERFSDNKKIEGTLDEQVEDAIAFIRKNMSVKTSFDKDTAKRTDIPEYPLKAVREAVLNAVIHRDYSHHTENQPIQILMFKDRMEIRSPGGLFGRVKINELGVVQPDTRNPNIIKALELMNVTENRFSGIPTIKKSMKEHGLPEPLFLSERGDFTITLFNGHHQETASPDIQKQILAFCKTPRALKEISDHIGFKSHQYIRNTFLNEMLDKGLLRLTVPHAPGSKYQKYATVSPK